MMSRVPLALAVAAAVTAGCGGSNATPEQLDQAVRSYTGAFLSGDGEKAAGMLSKRCDDPALHANIVQAARVAPALYGQAKLVSVTPTVDGDHGTVTYRFDQPAIDQENQRWVWESGAWRYDQC